MSTPSFESRYQHSPCGLVTTAIDGVILDANATLTAWLGYREGDLAGRHFSSLLDPGSRLFLETRHNQVLHLAGRVDQIAMTMVTADDTRLPVLLNSALADADGESVVHSAIFDATERLAYERDLLESRRTAELSATRLELLQDISGAFGVSTTDEEVGETVVRVARDAFAATAVSFMLFDENDELHALAGVNPLFGVIAPIAAIRDAGEGAFLSVADARGPFPELAGALHAARLEAITVTPLMNDGARLGLLACFFGRERAFDTGFRELQRALSRQAAQTLVRVRLQNQLERMARYDQLTGVPNRSFLAETLHGAIAEATQTGLPLSVLFMDVDGFKHVNDAHGHATGDEVLQILAARLRDGLRHGVGRRCADGDTIGRIGGDEFVAVCTAADADAVTAIAERVLEIAREPISTSTTTLTVSVSIGATIYSPASDPVPTADALLNRADDAMYSAKAGGKDQLTVSHRA